MEASRNVVLDSKESADQWGLSIFQGTGLGARGLKRVYICKRGSQFLCIFGGCGGEPVSTFIVAGEDTAVVSNQKSPTYWFIGLSTGSLVLVPAPRILSLG